MKRPLIILTAFAVFFGMWYFNIPLRLSGCMDLREQSLALFYTIDYLAAGLVPLTALFLLHKPSEIARSMGLSRGCGTGLLFALAATLPMLVGYAVIGKIDSQLTLDKALTWIFIAGFFEEVMYRGFAFGQLFRYSGWGFLSAGLPIALLFGALHLYQGHDLASALGSFGVTAAGGLFFSWIYVEWNFNLWTAIWLHTLMNLPWIVFNVSDSGAVGGATPNILRITTIILAIGLTVIYKKHKGLPYRINFRNLFINKPCTEN